MTTNNFKIKKLLDYCLLITGLAGGAYFLNLRFAPKEIGPSQQPYNSPGPSITLTGKLQLKLFPGPPEYSSIDDGDRADYCWVLELDPPSFLLALNTPVDELRLDLSDILRRSNANEVMLTIDEDVRDLCRQCEYRQVAVKGLLFHAHTAHHYTPMLIDVQQLIIR